MRVWIVTLAVSAITSASAAQPPSRSDAAESSLQPPTGASPETGGPSAHREAASEPPDPRAAPATTNSEQTRRESVALPTIAAHSIQRGNALFDRGHYDGALAEFGSAYEQMVNHPRQYQVLYNMAFCYERSFRYERAITFYRRFLSEGGDTDPRAVEARSVLQSLEGLLGTVEIVSPLERIEVWVDDYRVANEPGQVLLPSGTHTIEVRAPGHLPSRHEAVVRSGDTTVVRVDLESVDAFRGLPRSLFWVTAGLAASTLLAGAGVGIAALSSWRDLELRLASPRTAWSVTEQEHEDQQRLSLAADILFGIGALIAATAIVFGLLTDWDHEQLALDQRGIGVRF